MNKVKLALGTVQFGLSYGVANQRGQVPKSEIGPILALAREHGIDLLDTAIAYGTSEQVLGEIGVADWRIITKLPAVPTNIASSVNVITQWVRGQVECSRQRLKVDHINAVLLHRPVDLLTGFGPVVFDALNYLKSDGIIGQLGVSIYGPEDLEMLIPFEFDLIQAPFNVLDRRLHQTGWAQQLHHTGVNFHARSVFLQGLLLLAQDARPIWCNRWHDLWQRWDDWLQATNTTPLQACLNYALALPEIEQVIVGVDSYRQLEEILVAASTAPSDTLPDIHCDDPDLINPSRWQSAL